MEVLSIKLMYDILEDLIAKWATRYKLLVAREQSWSPLATGRPLILVPALGVISPYVGENILSHVGRKCQCLPPCSL